MKRFQFRLGHLLGLREQEESLAKLNVGQAARRCDELRLEIEDVQRRQRETGYTGGFDPAALFVRQAYLTRLKHKREELGTKLVSANDFRLTQLAIYVAARQHAEVLRKLKEKRLDEHLMDMQRQDDANSDDIVLSRRRDNEIENRESGVQAVSDRI